MSEPLDVKTNDIDEKKEIDHFNASYLKKVESCNGYVEHISDTIDLSNLYEVVNSSYNNEMSDYAVVLVKINDQKVKKSVNDMKYLL
jgi:hypothetical protein